MLRSRLERLAKQIPCAVEWIFVDDGSRDLTFSYLNRWAEKNSDVKIVRFSRNFGHQAAITAGIDHASGEAVVVMDADLQDPPELVLQMLAKYREGYDVCYAQRTSREGENLTKLTTARAFYWIMKKFVHKDLPMNTGEFRLMSASVAQALKHMREGQRFLRGMSSWVGFSQVAIPFDRPERSAGVTKFPMRKMILFALDAIFSFSSLPLRLSFPIGFFIFAAGFVLGGYYVYRKIVYNDLLPGWPSLIVLNATVGGFILMFQGLLGEYVGRIYEEMKERPLYVVRSAINIDTNLELPRRAVPGNGKGSERKVKWRKRQ